MASRVYRGCDIFYPASSRLNSVPPMHYEVWDEDGTLLASDLIDRGRTRARSMARQAASEARHINPRYRDMVDGGTTASPGHHFPRSPAAYSRDLLARSRSPSPFPETINQMNKDFVAEIKEKIHHSKYKARYPETYRGSASVYNSHLGRNMVAEDSPGYRYYRYSSSYSDPVRTGSRPPRYCSRLSDIVYVPVFTR